MPLSPSAQKVQTALDAHQLNLQVIELTQSTRTAQEAADAVGCELGQIVKSIVFRAAHSGRVVLALTSGANRVREAVLAEALGEPLEKASADFVRARTGFVIGGVAPVGHTEPPVVFMDATLLNYATLWAAAGTPNALFQVTPAQLQTISGGTVLAW